MSLTRNKKILFWFCNSLYEHSFDVTALKALENTSWHKIAGDYINKQISKRLYSIKYTESNIRYKKYSYFNQLDYDTVNKLIKFISFVDNSHP